MRPGCHAPGSPRAPWFNSISRAGSTWSRFANASTVVSVPSFTGTVFFAALTGGVPTLRTVGSLTGAGPEEQLDEIHRPGIAGAQAFAEAGQQLWAASGVPLAKAE